MALVSCTLTSLAKDVYTPVSSESTTLKWSLKLGTSYRDAAGVPLPVGDAVLVMSGKKLYKLDSDNGEIIKTATLSEAPGYNYVPVAYCDGTVVCPLDDGVIEAYDYETFERIWTYTDVLGGQAQTNITYYDGYIYAGFWNGETDDASYVCLDISSGKKIWSFAHTGGFYRADCTIKDNYVIFGGDDGTSDDNSPSKLYCLDRLSGKVYDTLDTVGDIRSGVLCDESSNRCYVTSKAGLLYSAKITEKGFDKSSVKTVNIGGASTSTPSLCRNRLYIGVQKTGTLSGYVRCFDSESLEILWSCDMNGYPQSKLLVNDIYGYVSIYSTYNNNPGGITLIADDLLNNKQYVSQLFVPEKGKTGYCISPVNAGEDGTLYYKNDSGYIFALSSKKVDGRLIEIMKKFLALIKKIIAFLNVLL